MIIKFSPQRRDDNVVYEVYGDTVVMNGEPFDFSPIEDGDILPQKAIFSQWIASDVTRVDGQLELTLMLPNPWNYSQEQAFPVPITVTEDGAVPLPQPPPEEAPFVEEVSDE